MSKKKEIKRLEKKDQMITAIDDCCKALEDLPELSKIRVLACVSIIQRINGVVFDLSSLPPKTKGTF